MEIQMRDKGWEIAGVLGRIIVLQNSRSSEGQDLFDSVWREKKELGVMFKFKHGPESQPVMS